MNLILSFVGTLPKYILYCIHQIRLFTKIPIYLIYSDSNKKILKQLENMNVNLI